MTTAYVSHSDSSRHDTGWGHPEHQGRLPAVARAVYRDMLTLHESLLEVEAVPATEADLLLAHDAAYVRRVRERVREAAEAGSPLPLEGDTVVSGASWEAAVASAGAALTGVETVLRGEARNAFCATRPPGHGAGRASSSAYALFNHAAIAALHLVERRGLERVLLVEVGARAGAGSVEILARHPGVHMVSLHQAGAGDERWSADVPRATLPAGADGTAALEELERLLAGAAAHRPPDFVLLSLGCDALASDPRGGLGLLPADYHALTVLLRERAEEWCGGRLVSVLEEGYDPAGMGAAVVHHLRGLASL